MIAAITTVLTFLRFVVPQNLSTEDWSNYNKELSVLLQPIHHALSTDLITPAVAGDQIGLTIQEFLKSKPEFLEDKKSSKFIKHDSKTLEKAKSAKNLLRKAARKSNDPNERRQFYQAIRTHNFLKKLQDEKDKHKSGKYQEKLFREDFFGFSKSVCNGSFGESQPSPSFDKTSADNFYRSRYSQQTPVDVSGLSWFPKINQRKFTTPFNLEPFRPKDIRSIIKSKSNSSSPGPDGITYGILKKLHCTHGVLATLYSKLLSSPEPPPSWGNSKITLIYKKGESNEPSNFRMIALSSVLGKVFHLLLSQRISTFVTSNELIDPKIQKAFMHNINGVIEHNQCLQEIIKSARVNKKTAHVTFFDLEDAFGSVQHNLISFCLKRFQFPDSVHDYIMNLYQSLNGTVVTKSWTSENFKFNKGVFQGDPLSPIIFLIVFNPLIERLQQEIKFGYEIQNMSYISTPFADDFNIITTNRNSHQRIINLINNCCKSMGLKLKPSKCRSLSIVSGSSCDIPFSIDGIEVETLKTEHHKFLGSTITYSGKQRDIFEVISEHFSSRLDNIDSLLIRNEFKVKIYRDYLLPASRFILTVHTLSSTNLDRLDSLSRKYLKSWLNLPPCATVPILHNQNFLDIKSISQLYKESQTCAFISSRIKADNLVNNALDSRLDREKTWTRKSSILVEADNVMKDLANPSNLESAKKEAKVKIKDQFQSKWDTHIRSLSLQGNFLELLQSTDFDVDWKSIAYSMPRNVIQFLLNSSIDTLPTNANLVRWNKRSSPNCKLCSNKETLLHTFNNCQTMLNQGRYTWRHNSILNIIVNFLKSSLSDSLKLHSDLPGLMSGISTIPCDILATALKPDITLVNRTEKTLTLIELTVPFDNNINSANKMKTDKYENLVNDLESEGFTTRLYPIEISSRGLITKENSLRLKEIMKSSMSRDVSAKELRTFFQRLQKSVIVCSYIIFHSKYESVWTDPPFVEL